MLEGLAPPDPPLTDGVITLRPPDVERDAETVAPFNADPEIIRWILGARPPDDDPTRSIEQHLERWRRGSDATFSIDAVGHDRRVGVTRVLLGLVDPFRFAEVGYILMPWGRGQGYATRTVRLVARWVFDDLDLTRLQARTDVRNVASQRVLERVGFQREGVARSGHVLPLSGERIDTLMWSLLPGELR